ncbi:MAG: AMP-binding protein [Deltaproteobacteria bacterium]|nr:AMP-binding protein [Deltaproteobacteria bacterium]
MQGRFEKLSELGQLSALGVRVGARTGLAYRANAKGLGAVIEQRLRGGLGLASVFRIHGASQPDALALSDERQRLTYGEVDARVDRLAGELSKRGIGKGAPVVIVLHNRLEVIEMQAVATRLGGAAVSASWRSTVEELAYIVEHSGARAMVIEADLVGPVLAARDRFARLGDNLIAVAGAPGGTVSYDELAKHGTPRPIRDGAEEGAVVIYTSGTTGKPKGAVRTFGRDAHLAYMHILAELPVRADDRHLAVCPLYHSTAFAFATITLLLGGSVHVEMKFDAERALAVIARERITTTAMVPTMLHRILQLPEPVRARYDVRSLRAILSGGAPLSGTLAREVCEELGHVLYNFYGATETGINTIATPDELLRSPGTIGHAVGGNDIRILDDDGRLVPEGTTGELFVKNSMLVRYHGDDDATRASMRDGYFSVGDLAHRDVHGLFHIDGRKRDMLISGGVNVYPAEIEEVLATHPAVLEIAIVGAPDPDLGEKVKAFVALRDGMTTSPEELVGFARSKLSGPKIPREIVFLPELPKNPTGKILKRELRLL